MVRNTNPARSFGYGEARREEKKKPKTPRPKKEEGEHSPGTTGKSTAIHSKGRLLVLDRFWESDRSARVVPDADMAEATLQVNAILTGLEERRATQSRASS